MKNWNDNTEGRKEEIAVLFATWLKPYTHEVIVKVMEKADEIVRNEFAMNLLKELRARTVKEECEFIHDIKLLCSDFETFKEYDPHNHPITHSGSYRDVLYDMYIKSI